MTAERSERGALTTNADYTNYDTFYEGLSVSSTQWSYDSNTVLYINFSASPPSYPVLQKRCIAIAFNGTTVNNDELEFGIISRVWNENYTGSALSETNWFPTNTEVYVRGNILRYTDQYPSTAYTCFVRRKDGGILTPSSMESSVIMLHNDRQINVEQTTAIPQNWLETTTASFQNPMDTYTTIIPTDYDISSSQYDPLLEIPSKIDTAINFIILGFGRIMNFRYISFVVCFVLIVGLVAWLIH